MNREQLVVKTFVNKNGTVSCIIYDQLMSEEIFTGSLTDCYRVKRILQLKVKEIENE